MGNVSKLGIGLIMAIVIFSVAADQLWKPVKWICGSDVCTENVNFCNVDRRTCEFCEDYKQDCFTNWQPQNCTEYCMSSFCPIPNIPRNSYITPGTDKDDSVHVQPRGPGYGTQYLVGQKVRIKCEDGYNLKGSANITCGRDGHWEHPVFPACYPESVSPVWKTAVWIEIAIIIVSLTLVPAGIVYCLRLRKKTEQHRQFGSNESLPLIKPAISLDKQTQTQQDCRINMLGDGLPDNRVLAKQRYDDPEDEETELKIPKCTKSRQKRGSHTDDGSQSPTERPASSKVADVPGVTFNINNIINNGAATATATATADSTVNKGPTHATNHTKEQDSDERNDEKDVPYPVKECGDKLSTACRPEGVIPDECSPGSSELPEIKQVTVPIQPLDNDSFRANKVGIGARDINMDDISRNEIS